MGCIRAGTDVFHLGSFTKGVKSTFEFSTIIGTHTQGGAKDLKDLFVNSTGDGFAGFIGNGGKYNKFTITTHGDQQMHAVVWNAKTNNQVQAPLATWAWRQG
jgi:hypothetical protein